MTNKLFFILLSLFLSCTSSAQDDPGTIEAEKDLVYYSADIISADLITEEATLTGNVKILFDSYELSAKNAKVSKKDGTLVAWGDVIIEGNNSYIEADKANLNYREQTGDLENVRLTAGQLFLQAYAIKKISNNVYEATRAKFTTCNTCPPSWSIKGQKIILDITKFIDVRGGKFKILNQSIIPLPRIVYPLNTRRKTGMLQPSLDQAPGNSGLGLQLPYFWAIDPHRDLTLTPTTYFDNDGIRVNGVNGLKMHTEYRQWLGSKSRLNLNSAYMYDDSYLNPDGSPNPTSRWFIDYTNFFVLSGDVVQKTDFTFLKERVYLQDFTNEVPGYGLAALKNKFSLSKAKENTFASAEIAYYINLLVEDPSDTNNLSVHKLPELSYHITETPFWGSRLLFKGNSTYTNFHRNSNSFDSVNFEPAAGENDPTKTIDENAGVFDASKDLIRTGHRLKFDAQVSAPFKIGQLFDVMPAINYRDSYYNFNPSKSQAINISEANPYSQFANSRYLELATSFRTEFSKVISKNIKHKIAPELTFKLGTPIDQTDNVFFQSQGDLPYHRQYQPITDDDFFNPNLRHGVQFDYWDRFYRAETVEFSLTNILIRKNKQELVTYYDQPLFFSLTQSYDFLNARTATVPDPWSNLDGVLKFRGKNFTNLTKFSHFYKAERTNISTTNTLNFTPGKFIAVGYSDFFFVDQAGQLITNNRTQYVSLGLGWDFPILKISGDVRYSLQQKRDLGWRGNFEYTPLGNCWGLGFSVIKIDQVEDLGYRFSLHMNFGPDPRTKQSLLTI
jgi:lipopolysaccharide assembly outer membrane protein LptD (OstA)